MAEEVRSAAVEEKPPTIGKEDAEPKACDALAATAARPEEKENVCVSSSENVQEVKEGGTTLPLLPSPARKKRGPPKEPKEQCSVCLRYYSLKRVVPGGHANCVPPVAKEKTIKAEGGQRPAALPAPPPPPPPPPEDDRNHSVASMSSSFVKNAEGGSEGGSDRAVDSGPHISRQDVVRFLAAERMNRHARKRERWHQQMFG